MQNKRQTQPEVKAGFGMENFYPQNNREYRKYETYGNPFRDQNAGYPTREDFVHSHNDSDYDNNGSSIYHYHGDGSTWSESTMSTTGNNWGTGEDYMHRVHEADYHSGKGPKNYVRSDARISDDVHEALTGDHHVDASDIEVSVKDGIVTLHGHVTTRKMKRAAEDCVEQVNGVKDVVNEISAPSFFDSLLR